MLEDDNSLFNGCIMVFLGKWGVSWGEGDKGRVDLVESSLFIDGESGRVTTVDNGLRVSDDRVRGENSDNGLKGELDKIREE